jgi:hypothetical protein
VGCCAGVKGRESAREKAEGVTSGYESVIGTKDAIVLMENGNRIRFIQRRIP